MKRQGVEEEDAMLNDEMLFKEVLRGRGSLHGLEGRRRVLC
jgi:hypothetical protein